MDRFLYCTFEIFFKKHLHNLLHFSLFLNIFWMDQQIFGTDIPELDYQRSQHIYSCRPCNTGIKIQTLAWHYLAALIKCITDNHFEVWTYKKSKSIVKLENKTPGICSLLICWPHNNCVDRLESGILKSLTLLWGQIYCSSFAARCQLNLVEVLQVRRNQCYLVSKLKHIPRSNSLPLQPDALTLSIALYYSGTTIQR